MVNRKIIWTYKANLERKDILEYWINRNQSKSFSIKLNHLFINTLETLAKNPAIGRKTSFENVHVKIVRDYLLFYQFDDLTLKVLSVWDSRRNDANLELK